MDVALGLKRPPGPPKGTQRGRLRTAIHIHYLLLWGETWNGIADRYQMDVRTLQRIYETHADGIVEHLSGDYFVPLGYDLKDGKLIVNKSEAATVRMIFERFAQMDSASAHETCITALVRKLKAEGITGKRGKPIDEGYLYRLLNNRDLRGRGGAQGHVSRQAQGDRQPGALEQSSQDFVVAACTPRDGRQKAR